LPKWIFEYMGALTAILIIVAVVGGFFFNCDYRLFLCRMAVSEALHYWTRGFGILFFTWGALLWLFQRRKKQGEYYLLLGFAIGIIPLALSIYSCPVPNNPTRGSQKPVGAISAPEPYPNTQSNKKNL
jgi:hypothetical protein